MANHTKTYLATAVTAALASSISVSVVNAEENPFQMTSLSQGYMYVENDEGQPSPEIKESSGSVGNDKLGSGQCGEGQCGTNAKGPQGKMTGSKGNNKLGDGKCGEGQCGTDELKK